MNKIKQVGMEIIKWIIGIALSGLILISVPILMGLIANWGFRLMKWGFEFAERIL
ncbi:MAG: hypothetical protein V1701_02600 [Planctomycetota bacterium]